MRLGRNFLLFAIVTVLSSSVVVAQEQVVEDTLDWMQYLPLEISNVWEYEDDNFPRLSEPKYLHFEIVGDTVISDTTYFIRRDRSFDTDLTLTSESRTYLRYDSVATNVKERTFGGCCEGVYDFIAPDLSANFGDTLFSSSGSVAGFILGGYTDEYYHIGTDSTKIGSRKLFQAISGPYTELGHGIGDLGGPPEGGQNNIRLVYARLGGEQYGSSFVATSIDEFVSQPRRTVKLYPNPFSTILTFHDSESPTRIEAFDILGRNIYRQIPTQCLVGECRLAIDGSQWPSGPIFVRVSYHDRISLQTVIHIE